MAVVGLSDRPYRTSHAIARALQGFGFRILPVNPNLPGPVLGEEPYATVEEIPEPVDTEELAESFARWRRDQRLAIEDDYAARLVAVGVVTDRDLVRRAMARGLEPDARVDGVMSSPVITIAEDADLHDAREPVYLSPEDLEAIAEAVPRMNRIAPLSAAVSTSIA